MGIWPTSFIPQLESPAGRGKGVGAPCQPLLFAEWPLGQGCVICPRKLLPSPPMVGGDTSSTWGPHNLPSLTQALLPL